MGRGEKPQMFASKRSHKVEFELLCLCSHPPANVWLVGCMLDSFEGAIAKSARAAGISANLAEKYAAEMVQKLPGKNKMDNKS